jgi:hypothetical protein
MWSVAEASPVAMRWDASLLIAIILAVMRSIMRVRGVKALVASQGPGKAVWADMLLCMRALAACLRIARWGVRR